MRERFHITYDIVTPESADRGDSAEAGYITSGGMHIDVVTTKDRKAAALDLHSAIAHLGCLEDSGSWFTEIDGRDNYRTGEHETRSLHPPRNITPSSYRRLCRLLTTR